jgi:hypothetical protein
MIIGIHALILFCCPEQVRKPNRPRADTLWYSASPILHVREPGFVAARIVSRVTGAGGGTCGDHIMYQGMWSVYRLIAAITVPVNFTFCGKPEQDP